MEYRFLTSKITSEGLLKKSKIEVINYYLTDADFIIKGTQNAINNPTPDNESVVSDYYTKWLYSVYMFVGNFDKDSAKILFSSPDGVHTSLNQFKERIDNPSPNYKFVKGEDGKYYADEAGIRQLQNIVHSLNEKKSLLKEIKLKITGGLISEKNTKKPTIILYKIGTIKINSYDNEIKRRKNSFIIRIIKKLRETDSVKIINLEKELSYDKSNISRDITKLNNDVLTKWLHLTDKVIDTNGNGYFMNRQAYNFFYEDISDFK